MFDRAASWSALALIALCASACCQPVHVKMPPMQQSSFAGWVAMGLTPEPMPADIAPEYQGLIGKSVAVMVAADERTLFQFPRSPERICEYVTNKLEVEVRGIRVIDPKRIARFVRDNPDWIAIPYGDLVRELKVDRVVLVSLAQYATRDDDNRDIWQGYLVARVGVVEAESTNPHALAYVKTVSVRYPDQPIGLLRSNSDAIEVGLNSAFADRLGAMFRELKPKVENQGTTP